jgi:plasmid stabilization system protein ParE
MRLIYHPEAEAELIAAAQFYEDRVPALGAQFLEAIDAAASVILQDPRRWRAKEGEIRRYMLPRFPYAIYYRVLPDEVRVLAIKHHRRHPDYWRNRTQE